MSDRTAFPRGQIRRIGSRLYQSPVVRTASWTLGTFLHHTVASWMDGRTVPGGRGARPAVESDCSDGHILSTPPGISNPVLTARDVTDYGDVEGVADPFLFVAEDGTWHMFFEVLNRSAEPTAVIGHATSPDNGYTWEYDRVVLSGDVHLTFPYVFKWEETHYMIPDPWHPNSGSTAFRLYEARHFPYEWTEVATILTHERDVHDCVVFRWQDRWWAIVGNERDLFAFYSPTLGTNGWEAHDQNPVVRDRPIAARSGGKPIVQENSIVIFYQDCKRQYGEKVRAFEITELSPETYRDEPMSPSPLLKGTGAMLGWNSGKMHHVSPQFDEGKWLCAVDGNIRTGRSLFGDNWSIGIYELHPHFFQSTATPQGSTDPTE